MLYVIAVGVGVLLGGRVNVFVLLATTILIMTGACVLSNQVGLLHATWSAVHTAMGLQTGYVIAILVQAYWPRLIGDVDGGRVGRSTRYAQNQ